MHVILPFSIFFSCSGGLRERLGAGRARVTQSAGVGLELRFPSYWPHIRTSVYDTAFPCNGLSTGAGVQWV